MKNLISKIIKSGGLVFPIAAISLFGVIYGIPPSRIPTKEGLIAILFGSLIFTLIVVSQVTNTTQKLNESDGREVAKYPPVNPKCLYAKPQGFCFGKQGRMYVCKDVSEPGSILVQGASGSGKSSTIIESFLVDPENQKKCNYLVNDLKHELVDNCVKLEQIYDPNNPSGTVIIMDPVDRVNGFGYDPFYALSEKSTEYEVHDVMEVVANSIIPTLKGDSAVWSQAAQQYARGAFTYFYRHENITNLPEIVKAMKAQPIKEIVSRIIENCSPDSPAYIDCISFLGCAEETITSVDMNLSQCLVQFYTNPDLAWCLGYNPKKCNPTDLLSKSIYLCLPEDKLQEWGKLVILVYNQHIKMMMGLSEKSKDPDRKWLAMILDETVALLAGAHTSMPLLSQCLRIGARGKGCTMVICVQSIAGLYQSMGRETAQDFVSNTTFRYVLDSTESESSKEIIGWCGKYKQRKVSTSGVGMTRKDSISYSEDNIVTEQDLMSLPKNEEAILISPLTGYVRLKKCFVFKDKYFKPLLEAVANSKKNKEK